MINDLDEFAERTSPGHHSFDDRIHYLIIITLALLTISIARILRPSPLGVGTHRQLGLPPCPFLHLTGLPCPNCGITTSFAHAARLNIIAAFMTQPFGLLAFLITIAAIPLSIYCIRKHIPWAEVLHSPWFDRLLYLLLALYLIAWIYKIIVFKSISIAG